EGDHEILLQELAGLDLLDVDPEEESRRNIVVAPFWTAGDLTHRLESALAETLPQLPDLPSKFGFTVDCGPAPILTGAPADIRLERRRDGLILRLDGMRRGRPVAEEHVPGAVVEAADWFAAHRTPEARR